MLVLERKGDEVFCEGQKLTIVKQATKGPGKEVVKVDGLAGANGQKWVSLSKLNEGLNEIETSAHERVVGQKYELTQEEKDEIAMYQSKIDSIIENAKKRYVPTKIDLTKLTVDDIPMLEEYLKRMKGIKD